MFYRRMLASIISALALAAVASAHCALFVDGMYCKGGPNGTNLNANDPVNPLYQMDLAEWWMQEYNGCKDAPPAEGDILNLPAGGQFTGEIAHNQAQTTLSYDGQYAGIWPDGENRTEPWQGPGSPLGCIQDDGAMHTQNQSMAAGTAVAISYNSNIDDVTIDNLAVFTVRQMTPWKRITTYDVPADMPPCPEGGCICAFLWVPNGCGTANMYMQPIRCNVTGSTSTAPIATPQPPTYCCNHGTQCDLGSKQMIAWHQNEGNNVDPPSGVSPAYNPCWGFNDGAQNGIFGSGSGNSTASSSSGVPVLSTSAPFSLTAIVSPTESATLIFSTSTISASNTSVTLAVSSEPTTLATKAAIPTSPIVPATTANSTIVASTSTTQAFSSVTSTVTAQPTTTPAPDDSALLANFETWMESLFKAWVLEQKTAPA